MKHFITCLLFVLCLVGFAHSDEVIVTPKNPNGWTFGIQGSSKTAKWLLGFNKSAPNLGTGDFWTFTGEADGCPYAETAAFRGVPIASITRIGYDSFTPSIFGRSDIHIAPEMRLYLDVPGYKPGEIYLQYSPGNQGAAVPTGKWTSWNPLLGKWHSNKDNTPMPLTEWVSIYREATISRMRLMSGTISSTPEGYRVFNNWMLGMDNVSFSYALNEIVFYNFESDPEPPKAEIKPIITGFALTIIGPTYINAPTYYIDNGAPQGERPAPEPKKEDVYAAESGYYYVPLVFNGNTDIKGIMDYNGQIDNKVNKYPNFTNGGSFLFGGVPFYIPKTKNAWAGFIPKDDKPHSLAIKANISGVVSVHTMITMRLSTEKGKTIQLVFKAKSGKSFTKTLTEGSETRCYVHHTVNTIEPPAKNVWTYRKDDKGEMRIDSQVITLPSDFLNEELESVTLVDNGSGEYRAIFTGITLKIKINK